MHGSYDYELVALSYLIASLAGYVAIEFATRMRVRSSKRLSWLFGGSLAMGTGIWSMHFVGMTAFLLPVPISFDLGITALSWLAAVAVSAIALSIVGYGRLTVWTLAIGALFMGAGVSLMHYAGMWAMRMDPGISYQPGLLAASIAIAVTASAAALLIISQLGEIRSWKDMGLRIGAALVMGVAVVGMHYTGMAAAIFQSGAYCATGNLLPSAWMPWPTTIAAVLILGFGITFAIGDARSLAAGQRATKTRNERLQRMAFTDKESGLPNRSRLLQLIVERASKPPLQGFAVLSFRLESRDGSIVTTDAMMLLHDRITTALPDAVIARTQPDHLVALVNGRVSEVNRRCESLIDMLGHTPALKQRYRLGIGSSHCPCDGNNAQNLLQHAVRQNRLLAEPAADDSVVELKRA